MYSKMFDRWFSKQSQIRKQNEELQFNLGFKEGVKQPQVHVVLDGYQPTQLETDVELEALISLRDSLGWRLITDQLVVARMDALRDNLKATDISRVAENRGKVDIVESLMTYPAKKIKHLQKESKS
jgi:hypothetical protein